MRVPFLYLKDQFRSIKDEVSSAFEDILATQGFIQGKYVAEFENNFAPFCGARHAIGVNSGTSALYLILMAYGIGPGDEVITVPNTFIATAEAISLCGARPVFVDIDERTFNIDAGLIEKAITPSTRAIIPVHLYGQCSDMGTISEIAKGHGIKVIEDACQAHGAEYKGKKAGSLGVASAFSFYPGKNLGAFGEAGAVVTDSDEIAEKVRLLRNHGSAIKYYHELIGGNFRMEELQGAVLSIKLKYLEGWNNARRKNAGLYSELLSGIEGVTPPIEAGYGKHVYHIYLIRAKKRDELQKYLGEKGIGTLIHYPVPLHLQKAYNALGYKKGDFPVTERVTAEILSLPMYPEMSPESIETVCESIREFYKQ